jgi:hypothetical protein
LGKTRYQVYEILKEYGLLIKEYKEVRQCVERGWAYSVYYVDEISITIERIGEKL